MWNFVGRQNDIHSPSPGELFYGNWESGVSFIDNLRLGDQSDAPKALKENKGKNHYFFLPLLLGLLGLFFQFDKDKRGCWLTFLLFFMTGLAIVLYLNQPPYQVRERDYAYAGSFYAFSIWIGLAVAAIFSWVETKSKGKGQTVTSSVITAVCLLVPVLMAAQNWDDHDRSNRRTAVEMAKNYLQPLGPQTILVTHGDNDTFPLWYAQEVESIRPDVRICNTSLLGTDWYIGQMKWAINESKPLPITIGEDQYLYGTNDFVYIYDTRDQVIPLRDVMTVFKHPDAKATLEDGSRVDYIVSRKISVPVNKENVIKYGILPESYRDSIPDSFVIQIPKDKNYLSKPELFMLDLLDGYQWDRPINLLSLGGDINIGIKDYLMFDGFSSRLIPIKNRQTSSDIGIIDHESLYNTMMNVLEFDALKAQDYFVDYQNLYTFLGVLPIRETFLNAANAFMRDGETEKAVALMDKAMEVLPVSSYPIETISIGFYNQDISVIGMIDSYYEAGEPEKARALSSMFSEEILSSTKFFMEYYDYAKTDFERCCNIIYYLADIMKQNGDKDGSDELMKKLETMLRVAVGDYDTLQEDSPQEYEDTMAVG